MLAKLSTLALCLSLVSALDISAPLFAYTGSELGLTATIANGDPTNVDLYLCWDETNINLWPNAPISPNMQVWIPLNTTPGSGRFIAATAPGNRGIIYSKTNLIDIVDSQT